MGWSWGPALLGLFAVFGQHADSYEGEFQRGQEDGRGTLRYPDGGVNEGEWKVATRYAAVALEGHGTYRDANGGVHEGELKAGELLRGTRR